MSNSRFSCIEEERPCIKYVSGQTIYVETFEHGRLLFQDWSGNGQDIKICSPGAMRDRPADSFRLIVDGQDLRRQWKWKGFKTLSEKESVIHLSHADGLLELDVHTVSDDSGFFIRWLVIHNTGDTAFGITDVASWSGELFRDVTIIDTEKGISEFEIGRYLYRAWSKEGCFIWQDLPLGTFCLEANRGSSGWGPPFFVLRKKESEEMFLGQIAWSKNWAVEFSYEPIQSPSWLAFRAGPAGISPLRVIKPGESVETARIHLGFIKGNLDVSVQSLHRHLRESVMPDRSGQVYPPVSYNFSGAIKNEKIILKSVDEAVELGAECFIIDAGWFGKTAGNYPAWCGDWTPGSWFEHGMEKISEYVQEKGMKFGLWVAIEMVGNKAWIVREHPDWIAKIENRGYWVQEQEEDGHPGFYMNLDFANAEVVEWIEGEIERLIEQYHLGLLRLDGGAVSNEGGYRTIKGFTENLLWRQCENFYGILDRVRARHPALWIDNCQGGGGKLDAAMLARSEVAWISDDYHTSNLQIRSLNGVTLAMPPEICTRIFGTSLKKIEDLDFSLRVPLFGQYCICNSSLRGENSRWRIPSTPEYAKVKHHLTIFKNFIRPMLPTCRVFHHTPILIGPKRSPWCVLEYASADGNRAAIGVFLLNNKVTDIYELMPRGLNPDTQYSVTLESAGKSFSASGRNLMEKPIPIKISSGGSASELVLITV